MPWLPRQLEFSLLGFCFHFVATSEMMNVPVSYLYRRKNKLTMRRLFASSGWRSTFDVKAVMPVTCHYITVSLHLLLMTSPSVSLACFDWWRCQDFHTASPYLITMCGSFLWDMEKCLRNSSAFCPLHLSQSVSVKKKKITQIDQFTTHRNSSLLDPQKSRIKVLLLKWYFGGWRNGSALDALPENLRTWVQFPAPTQDCSQ